MADKLLTFLIPAYNEEECLHLLYDKLLETVREFPKYGFKNNWSYEFLLINDGSKDRTAEILEELHQKSLKDSAESSIIHGSLEYINLSRNYGKESAMVAGFDHARGDAVVILDADLQHPIDLIPQMLKLHEEGYDDVYGKRSKKDDEGFIKRLTSKIFYKVLQSLSKVDIMPNVGDFRLISRRALEALKEFRECERYTKGYFALIGFKKKEILYERKARAAGKTKWNYKQLTKLAIEGITSFTTAPLKLASIIGFIVALAGFLYMAFIIIKAIIFGDRVAGYPSLMAVILFIGGIQILFLGIIGEYLGRIFNETKNRPLYFISHYSKTDEKDR